MFENSEPRACKEIKYAVFDNSRNKIEDLDGRDWTLNFPEGYDGEPIHFHIGASNPSGEWTYKQVTVLSETEKCKEPTLSHRATPVDGAEGQLTKIYEVPSLAQGEKNHGTIFTNSDPQNCPITYEVINGDDYKAPITDYMRSVLKVNDENEIMVNYSAFNDPFTVVIKVNTPFDKPLEARVRVTNAREYVEQKGLCKNDGIAAKLPT